MHAAIAVPGSASTILTHVFGRGLADESYVVERYKTLADGDIRRMPGDETPAKGRRRAGARPSARSRRWTTCASDRAMADSEPLPRSGLLPRTGPNNSHP